MSKEWGLNPDRTFEDSSAAKKDLGKLPHPLVDIGPKSLLWQFLGDARIGLTGMSAGILQLMHPGVSAGVSDHSQFFDDPWGRILRSLPEIISVVYDPNGEEIGRRIKGYHNHIKGTDKQGRRYHALSPETFWWPHATFHNMVEELAVRFDSRPVSLAHREQLYQETNTWYERYGVSTKSVPENYAAFRKKWNDICDNTLELTPAAKAIIDSVTTRTAIPFPEMPSWLWEHGGRLPMNEFMRILAIGGLPENVRARFEIPWSQGDNMKKKVIEEGTKRIWPFVPKGYRDHPQGLIQLVHKLDSSVC